MKNSAQSRNAIDRTRTIETDVASCELTHPELPAQKAAQLDLDPPEKPACGRYEFHELVGQGGFGEVWRAFDPTLNRMVAIKRLRPDRERQQSLRDEFLEEARRVAKLRHDGIVPIYDIVEEDGMWFIISEFIAGGTLADRMKLGRISNERASDLVAKLALALQYAHSQGVIHRDIKPLNILLDESGVPFITDFGLATTEEAQLREEPKTKGTIPYMSPEQFEGRSNLLDARTDIYSLGVIYYQLLAGRLPFVADSFDQWREQIVNREPRSIRTIDESVPERLEEICLKCLRKPVAQRYVTARDLAADIQRKSTDDGWLTNNNVVAFSIACASILLVSAAAFGLPDLFAPDDPVTIPAPAIPDTKHTTPETPPPADATELVNLIPNIVTENGGREIQLSTNHKTVELKSPKRTLLAIGRFKEPSIELETVLHQLNWNGNVGLFFGHHTVPDQPTRIRYHCLQIYKRHDNIMELRAMEYDYGLHAPTGVHKTVNSLSTPIEVLQNHNTIRLKFDVNKATIFWNNVELTELSQALTKHFANAEEPPSGEFGVYAMHSAATFRNTAINGRQLSFQHDQQP